MLVSIKLDWPASSGHKKQVRGPDIWAGPPAEEEERGTGDLVVYFVLCRTNPY